MRAFLKIIPAAVLGCMALSSAGHAQSAPRAGFYAFPPMNSSALSNTPFVVVNNYSHGDVTGIHCTGNWHGSDDVSVPGGNIPAGTSAIVKFGASRCSKHMAIQTRDKTITLDGFDTNTNTTLDVRD